LLHLGYVLSVLIIVSGAIVATVAKSLIRAAIALGAGSAGLAMLFFMLRAPYAGGFELSVGAGLISVLFIVAISLTESMDMMGREDISWIVVVLVLLIAGFVISQRVSVPIDGEAPAPQETERRLFRSWFWEGRRLDLAVQVGLIFVGTLSIAALLPRSREDNGE
jgi:NADH-quinone oxidoreductase subunit J